MVVELRVDIYPLAGEDLSGDYAIADHINLSGSSPRHIGFVPITDLYVDKHNPDAIIVAGLKVGVKPTAEETEVLRAQGVKAYSYGLIEPALYAAANQEQVRAIGFVPRLPQGFKAAGVAAGIKASGRKDLAVVYSEQLCKWAGVFTQNLVRAACVDHNIASLKQSVQAIVCNSGNANACTGLEGAAADLGLRAKIAQRLKLKPEQVLSASTGKIGIQLEVDNINTSLLSLDNKLENIVDFAEAILTTDLCTKLYQTKSMIGFAKGSGMIAPNMATMLGFIISDAKLKINQKRLREILQEISAETFNAISVDNDTSTNDMLLFITNEQGAELNEAELKDELREICTELAKKIAIDGEGATKLIELSITNYEAINRDRAMVIAKTIINSPLAKSAIFGSDPNWGRIMAAAGRAAAELGLSDKAFAKAELRILNELVFANGTPSTWIQNSENRTILAEKMRRNRNINIELNLNPGGKGSFVRAWGCDLSYDYVRINAEYFT